MSKQKVKRPKSIRIRPHIWLGVLLFVLAGAFGAKYFYFSNAASSEHIITTLYAYPTLSSWSQVESSSPTVTAAIVDICAPDGSGSGCNGSPADAQNTDWNPTIQALKNKGITPLFYIWTNYGAVALSTVEAELAQAVSWYQTPSPMFDTMEPSGTCTNGGAPVACTTYYSDLYTYAAGLGATSVVFNPGTTYNVSSSDMFGSKEIICIYEGSASGFTSTSFPSWMNSYPASEFVAVLSAGSSTTIKGDIATAVADNIGNFYEDDEAEPNPNYSTLPAYWSTEVADVAAIGAATPTPTPTPTPSSSQGSDGTQKTTSSKPGNTATPSPTKSGSTPSSGPTPAGGAPSTSTSTTKSSSSQKSITLNNSPKTKTSPVSSVVGFVLTRFESSPIAGSIVILCTGILVALAVLRRRFARFVTKLLSRNKI